MQQLFPELIASPNGQKLEEGLHDLESGLFKIDSFAEFYALLDNFFAFLEEHWVGHGVSQGLNAEPDEGLAVYQEENRDMTNYS